MATITIRNLPKDLVERLKVAAARNKRSMEQEVRELLSQRYMAKQEVLLRIRELPADFPSPSARQVRKWIREGRR